MIDYENPFSTDIVPLTDVRIDKYHCVPRTIEALFLHDLSCVDTCIDACNSDNNDIFITCIKEYTLKVFSKDKTFKVLMMGDEPEPPKQIEFQYCYESKNEDDEYTVLHIFPTLKKIASLPSIFSNVWKATELNLGCIKFKYFIIENEIDKLGNRLDVCDDLCLSNKKIIVYCKYIVFLFPQHIIEKPYFHYIFNFNMLQ